MKHVMEERSSIMKIKRFLGIVLVCSMMFSMPIMAAEKDGSMQNYDAEAASLKCLESVQLDKQEAKVLSPAQVSELFSEQSIQSYTTVPDECEPNDTINTAYPYTQVPVVTSQLTSKYDLFGLGMRHAGLHSETDEDWFSISLTAGEDYFVDLRNIGKSNWYIELYYIKPDGTGYYYSTDPTEMPVFEKWQEKYFYFTAKDTGTYYIRIANGNDWSDEMHYFFYVGPAIQYFDIVNMPTYGSVQIYGNDYKTYTCDLSGTSVPKTTAIVNLYMTDNFPQGKECAEVEKYMSAGGKTYYSPSGGTSNIINSISGAPLGQRWTIGGRCANGEHFTYWSGVLNGKFGCVMAPYPGNEVSF